MWWKRRAVSESHLQIQMGGSDEPKGGCNDCHDGLKGLRA